MGDPPTSISMPRLVIFRPAVLFEFVDFPLFFFFFVFVVVAVVEDGEESVFVPFCFLSPEADDEAAGVVLGPALPLFC